MRIQKVSVQAILEMFVILYLYYCLTIVFFVVPPLALKAVDVHLGLRQGTAITLGCALIAEIIALAGVRAYYKRKGITIDQLGWTLPENKVVISVISLGVALLYILFSAKIPEVRANFTEISLFKLWGLVVGVAGAVMEEIVFRGYIMSRLEQAKIKPLLQVLLTAGAFSLLHLGFGLVGMLCTFLVGMALGGLYLLGQRKLFGPIICHGIINAALEPWLLLWLLQFYSEKFAG